MKKLTICERRDLLLVSESSEAGAISMLHREITDDWSPHLVEFKQWQVATLRDYSPQDVQRLCAELREKTDYSAFEGDILFAVTVHYEVSVYVNFSPGNDTGLAREPGVPVASDSEGASEGSPTTH